MQAAERISAQFALSVVCKMKLTLVLIVCCCCLLGWVHGDVAGVTYPPFVRSRYSLRARKTTTDIPLPVTLHDLNPPSTGHPKLASSTANADYDYYGNGEVDNIVHK